jgi:hypothetical protein
MGSWSDFLELARTAGGYIGAGGGLIAGRLYAELKEAVKNSKTARDLVKELVVKVDDLVSDLAKLESSSAKKEWVLHEINKLLRSSAPAIGGDELIKHRLSELERRISSVEDVRDNDLERSREWNEEIKGDLGEIMGMLKMSSKKD